MREASSDQRGSADARHVRAPLFSLPHSGNAATEPCGVGAVIGQTECEPVFDEVVLTALQDYLQDADLREVIASVSTEAEKCLNLIKAAIAKGDSGAVHDAAHALKGMSSNFGAARLAAIARRIALDSSAIEAVAGQVAPLERAVAATQAQIRLFVSASR